MSRFPRRLITPLAALALLALDATAALAQSITGTAIPMDGGWTAA